MEDRMLNTEGSDGPGYIKTLIESSNPLPHDLASSRMSKDTGQINSFGRKLIDLCKMSDMFILNGRAFQDRGIGNYTRVETNGQSVIDYAISDRGAFGHISNFSILQRLPESDHCPLLLELKNSASETDVRPLVGEPVFKYLFTKANSLRENLNSEILIQYIDKFYESLSNGQDVDTVSELWYDVLYNALDLTFDKVLVKPKRISIPWMDKEVRQMRKDIVKKQSSDDAIVNLQKIANYKSLVQQKKRKFRIDLLNQLDQACTHDGKAFWGTLKALPCNKTCTDVNPVDVYNKLEKLSVMPAEEYFDRVFESECETFLEKYDRNYKIKLIHTLFM